MKKSIVLIFTFIIFSVYAKNRMTTVTINKSGSNRYEMFFETESYLSKEELVNIFFYEEHVKQYLNHIVKPEILEEDKSYHKIKFNINILFYKNHIIYERNIIPSLDEIRFKVIEYSQNINLLPDITESSGFFQVSNRNNRSFISFYQYFILDKEIKNFYLNFSKKQAETYFKNLQKYINKIEGEK